jgi:preprotein translocase subunit YajC
MDQVAAEAANSQSSGLIYTLLMFGSMFAIFYFILIRPQQKQQKRHQDLIGSLKRGDEVILSSGIIGKIAQVEDRFITLEIGDRVKMRVLRQAVSGLATAEGAHSSNGPSTPATTTTTESDKK